MLIYPYTLTILVGVLLTVGSKSSPSAAWRRSRNRWHHSHGIKLSQNQFLTVSSEVTAVNISTTASCSVTTYSLSLFTTPAVPNSASVANTR